MFGFNKKTAFYSDKGGREINEDTYRCEKKRGCRLLVVADGLGGHDCGEIASEKAAGYMGALFRKKPRKLDVEAAISLANEQILMLQQDGKKMKTTLSVAYITKKKTVLAHVGDTRIYAFKNDRIVYQSIDHSVSQIAVKTGEIDIGQIRSHADRNKLTRALGNSPNVKADIVCLDNKEYDSLLICSDGFWEYVLEDEMIRTKISSAQNTQKWLDSMRNILSARVSGNNDNNTAIIMSKRR